MSDADEKYLERFPGWLERLAQDAQTLGEVVAAGDGARETREFAAAGVNYMFKSLDLIPDGIDDIGYLDDAFIVRVAASLAAQHGVGGLQDETATKLQTLSDEAKVVEEFLEETYGRLESYVRNLRGGAARGKTVEEVVTDSETRRRFLDDIHSFARTYEAPAFARESKNLIKLRAFFDAKLPK